MCLAHSAWHTVPYDVKNKRSSEIETKYIINLHKERQIIDGPLMVNEIIAWALKKNKKFMIFKVDFEKAFDSLDWNFLDNIMSLMGLV